jgi:hypothetical protein
MKPKPVKQSETPEYPTRRQLLKGGAAIVLFGPMLGCDRTTSGVVGPPTDESVCEVCGVFGPPVPDERELRNRPLVAPLFEHGEGRGVMGCDVAVPPVFLSEEEAMQIIREELTAAGFELGEGRELPNVAASAEGFASGFHPDSPEAQEERTVPVAVDAESDDPKLAVQYVSQEDCDKFFAGLDNFLVLDYDMKEVAGLYSEAIREQLDEPLTIGVFYDPMRPFEWVRDSEYEDIYAGAQEQSKESLRLQTKDFIEWLGKQETL